MGKTTTKPPEAETEDGVKATVPQLMMCTARVGELRIGPTLSESDVRIELDEGAVEGEQLDEALRAKGWMRRYDWWKDGAGAWTLVCREDVD